MDPSSTRPRSIPHRIGVFGHLLAFFSALSIALAWAPVGHAGGQGAAIPPVPLPVHDTELRIASQVRMVCVADPGTVCVAPYLDARTGATNSDGGTFRSASCPGVPDGACRPDYVTGADITGELIVDWPITRQQNVGSCGSSPVYEICHDGHIELNVTAPGVTVSNPVASMDSTDPEYPASECSCIDPDFDVESQHSGETLEPWWVTRNAPATCDIALEYATLVPRAKLLAIGREAFPSLLCAPDASGACTIDPVPVLVEPDGSLTKGCGTAPSNTFQIRFAHANEPVAFVRKPLGPEPLALGDTDADDLADVVGVRAETIRENDGNNVFSARPSGLPAQNLGSAAIVDWTDDGNPDLVAKPQTVPASGVVVYPGDGAGTFDDASSFTVDGATNASLTGAVDLNGDGLPDAVSDTGSTTNVAWNQTAGPTSPVVDVVATDTRAVVDLDADTDGDLVGLRSVPPVQTVEWASNAGPGGFAVQSAVDVPTGTNALVPLLGQGVVDRLECDPYASDCCAANGGLGCDDATCESLVCNFDFGCCSFGWDENCRDMALEMCDACLPPSTPDCCSERPGQTGCGITACESIVCGQYPSCCSGEWDDFCAEKARGWCTECHAYNVVCTAAVADVDGADVDGDGDTDLCLAVDVGLDLIHTQPAPGADRDVGYFLWLPNRQVDDPQASSGQPLFDPATEPWRLIGRSPSNGDKNAVDGPLEMIDVDGDLDPDVVGVGVWYRNEGGSFSGPYVLGRGSPAWSCGVDGLRAYWRFGGNADDATGCGNDGVVAGAVLAPDADGTPDSAYAFDGVDDYIDIGASPLLEPDLPVTISLFVDHDCPPAATCDLFFNDSASAVYSGIRVYIVSGGIVGARYGDGGAPSSASRRSATTTTPIAPNTWHHVAVVIKGPTDFAFYVDGVPQSVSYSGTGGPLVYLGTAGSLGGGAYGVPLDGLLDDVRLYARALSAEEIADLAAPGDPISLPPADPFESLSLDTLIVQDVDADGDADVVGAEYLWEQVQVPEPTLGTLLASGIAGLAALARRRRRR
jgi:hypothetical protein